MSNVDLEAIHQKVFDMDDMIGRMQQRVRIARFAALGAEKDPHLDGDEHQAVFFELVDLDTQIEELAKRWSELFELTKSLKASVNSGVHSAG